MQDRDFAPHSSGIPLGHKLLAVILAVGVGYGLYYWLGRNATESAQTAKLSFDADAARQMDPGLAGAKDPAVALADSILTDQAVAGLSKQAYLSSNAMASRVGEFRSRLELTEGSGGSLGVRFEDPDGRKAAETANAVANALAAWKPGAAAAPAGNATTPAPAPATGAAAASAAKPAPAAAPGTKAPSAAPAASGRKAAKASNGADEGQADHTVSDGLHQVETRLSSTSHQLDGLGGTGRGPRGYSQSRQQQLLNSEVRAAERTVAGLRAKADKGPTGVSSRLVEVQHALGSIWPASGARRGGGRSGFTMAGTSANQLRRERAELKDAIAVIQRERQAIEKAEGAATPDQQASDNGSGQRSGQASGQASGQSAGAEPKGGAAAPPVTESDLPAQSGSGSAAGAGAGPGSGPGSGSGPGPASGAAPAAAQSQGAAVQPQTSGQNGTQKGAASGEGSTLGKQGAVNPLHVERLASPAGHTRWWPPVLVGFLCGVLYLAIAASRYRSRGDEELYAEAGSAYGGRFITPDVVRTEPVHAESRIPEPVRTEPVRTEAEQIAPVQTAPEQAEPVQTEPVQSVPVPRDPARSETVPGEAVRTELVSTEPMRTEPVRAEAVRTEAARPDFASDESVRAADAVATDMGRTHSEGVPRRRAAFRFDSAPVESTRPGDGGRASRGSEDRSVAAAETAVSGNSGDMAAGPVSDNRKEDLAESSTGELFEGAVLEDDEAAAKAEERAAREEAEEPSTGVERVSD